MREFLKKQIGVILFFVIMLIGALFLLKGNIKVYIINTLIAVFIGIMNFKLTEDYKQSNQKNIEKFKTDLNNYSLVTKLQFDLEFKIYTEIFEELFNLTVETQKLAPLIDFLPETIDEKEKLYRKRLDDFRESYNKFAKLINKYKPFYSKNIYNALTELISLTIEEANCFDFSFCLDKQQKFDYSVSNARITRILKNRDELSDLIRNRIENMKIIEN